MEEAMKRLHDFLADQGGQLTMAFGIDNEWTVGMIWGQEAPDSDMAGGASFAVDPDLLVALTKVAAEVGA